MKDIDFDELDRAVSSLMGDIPKDNSAKQESDGDNTVSTDTSAPVSDDQSTPEEPTKTEGVQTDVPAEPTEPQEPAENEIKTNRTPMKSSTVHASQPSIAPNRRGLYMDMVRPSTTPAPKPAPVAPMPRQGVTLEPQGSTSLEEAIKNPPVEVGAGVEESAEPVEQPITDMPDPIAVAEAVTTGDAAELANEPAVDTPLDEPKPLDSPFLADARVEKRPLGRTDDMPDPLGSQPAEEQSDETDVSDDNAAATDMGTPPRGGDTQLPEQPLPAELSSEILNIESGINTASTDTAKETPPVSDSAAAMAPAANPAISASIPQQYKLQPKEGDETPAGAIYDTSTYHQPITQPEKKKSNMFIVIVVLGVVVSIAVGVAAYYFFIASK